MRLHVSAMLLLAATTAAAQDRASGLEEIVVTARARSESLQDVPLSITAFTAETIEKAAIFDVRDIARLSPSVTVQTTGGAGNGRFMPNLTFRGLQNVFPQPRAQVGAVFVDGNYVLAGVNAVNTNDVERVEVLRGPQNAYFARNTFAGAINFITKTPGDTFQSEFSGSGSTRGSYAVSASVDGPLIAERLAGRLTLSTRSKDGHYTAKDGGRLGDESTDAVSATLFITPSDQLSFRIRGNYQDDDDGPGTIINLSPQRVGETCRGRRIDKGTSLSGAKGFNVSLPYFCDKIPGIKQLGESIVSTNTSLRSPLLGSVGNPDGLVNVFINNSLGDPQWEKAPKPDRIGLKREIRSLNLQGQYEFSNGTTFAVTYGWEQNYQSLLFDGDRSDIETTYTYIPQFSRIQTIEARIRSAQDQRVRWLLGATHLDSELRTNFGSGGSLGYESRTLVTQPFRTAPLTAIALNRNPRSTDEVAEVEGVFGSIDWDVTEEFTVTGELRRQSDKSVSGGVTPPNFVVPPNTITFKDWLPRVIGTYALTEDWNVYASWSRGALPGVENAGFTSQTPFRQQLIRNVVPNIEPILASDHLDNYELGSKQTLLDGKFRYNLAAYYMKWNNAKAQAVLLLPATTETNPTPFTANVVTQGAVSVRGLEFEAAALITSKWETSGGLGWQKSKFLKWVEAGVLRDLTGGQSPGAVAGSVAFGAINWEGNEMQRQPRLTANLNSTYRDTLNDTWEWFTRGEVTYTGRAWDSTANIVKSSDYYRVNARLGIENESTTVELYILNMFNDKTWDYASRTAVGDLVNNATSAALPLGNAGFVQAFAVQAPDKRDFGVRVKYKF